MVVYAYSEVEVTYIDVQAEKGDGGGLWEGQKHE